MEYSGGPCRGWTEKLKVREKKLARAVGVSSKRLRREKGMGISSAAPVAGAVFGLLY